MTLQEILNKSNTLNEDELEDEEFIVFFDNAISQINVKFGLLLPFTSQLNVPEGEAILDREYPNLVYSDYPDGFILPQRYIEAGIIPLISKLVLEKDANYAEADRFMSRAVDGLRDLTQNKTRVLPKELIEQVNTIGEITAEDLDEQTGNDYR